MWNPALHSHPVDFTRNQRLAENRFGDLSFLSRIFQRNAATFLNLFQHLSFIRDFDCEPGFEIGSQEFVSMHMLFGSPLLKQTIY